MSNVTSTIGNPVLRAEGNAASSLALGMCMEMDGGGWGGFYLLFELNIYISPGLSTLPCDFPGGYKDEGFPFFRIRGPIVMSLCEEVGR